MKVVTCPMCGREFLTEKPNKKYCNFTCKEASQKVRRMKWQADNPDYYRDYMQKYRKDRKEGTQDNGQ